MKRHLFRHFTSILLVSALIFTFSCDEPDDEVDRSPIPSPGLPKVETAQPDSVEFFVAKSGGKIISDGGAPILYFGVCWSTSPNPTIELSTKTRKDTNLTGTYEFKHYPVFTSSQTKYYIRAYSVNKTGVAYGANTTIITKPTFMVDKSGFFYSTNLIGGQVWSSQNLRTGFYSNDLAGSPVSIPILPPNNASNASTWSNDVSGLACIYGDRSFTNGGNFTFYGLLYNYYAVVNPLNLCPNGWHVPSVEEWGKLIDSSGGINFAGKNLKGQSYSPSALRFSDEWFTKGNPIGNFSASPGGFRKGSDGSFGGINLEGTFWTSTNSNDTEALSISIKDNDAIIRKDIISDKKNGHSVRCVWNGDPL